MRTRWKHPKAVLKTHALQTLRERQASLELREASGLRRVHRAFAWVAFPAESETRPEFPVTRLLQALSLGPQSGICAWPEGFNSMHLVWCLRNSYTFVALKLAWGEARG